jgi:putative ABC transport system substrate-binding protein
LSLLGLDMRRREFLGALTGVAALPFAAAQAQQLDRVRHIGVLLPAVVDDSIWHARLGAFLKGLALLGWTSGGNVRIETRWATNNANEIRKHAAELAALSPDVILAGGSSSVEPLLQVTHTVPIVFTAVADPVGAGFVDSLARPGGNATGFMIYEFSIGGKWLELLKQIAPNLARVAVLRDTTLAVAMNEFAAIQAVAPSLKVEVVPVNMRNSGDIEQSIRSFARLPNGGLIPAASAAALRHRDLIIRLAALHKLPALYWDRAFVVADGLISYGPNLVDGFQQAANYVDRILKGEKPADLPVQTPTKYELVINLKTAMALGLEVPPILLARADEVIG